MTRSFCANLLAMDSEIKFLHFRALCADDLLHAVLGNRIADRIARSRADHLVLITVLPVDMQRNHLIGVNGIDDRSINEDFLTILGTGANRVVACNLSFLGCNRHGICLARDLVEFNSFSKRNDPTQARVQAVPHGILYQPVPKSRHHVPPG